MAIRVTGLSHRGAPIELRERMAIPSTALPTELAAAREALGATEAVILSTCNRVELIHVHEAAPADATEFLARRRSVPPAELLPRLYVHDGLEAARHLFAVAAGFDSMVPGETQILGQVREAYHVAHESGSTGRTLNKLFQSALTFAKRVHTGTSLAERSVSIPSVAARLAGKIFSDLGSRTLLVVGAGETGRLAVEAFRERGVRRILVANRTLEKGRNLGTEACSLEDLPTALPRADLLVSCLSSEGFVLTLRHVQAALEARRREPMVLLDLGVPRNIHPDVNQLDNVYLFDIDDLQEIVRQNLRDREREIQIVQPDLERAADLAMSEIEALDLHRILAQLRELFHRIGDEEAKKTLSRLSALDCGPGAPRISACEPDDGDPWNAACLPALGRRDLSCTP